MVTTDLIETAARFVNATDSHIFLTGKAGTGKTTFLRNIAQSTHKRFVIVAPTGIAALNAGGVTIHSQFLLPFGTFIPDRQAPADLGSNSNYYTQRTLATRHPLNSPRRQVLRGIDLLIIDEVSMLRADILDAIDYRLRAVRNNFSRSFGGVQVLMIGDLYQLPPIVKDSEKTLMSRYYRTPHFFEAKALQQDGFVFVELDRIFRQRDDRFISLLNNLRNNVVTADDISELNKHYTDNPPSPESGEDIVTITTHNYKADDINNRALQRLGGPKHFFDAELKGDFPESAYPVLPRIELKKGTQIMFVKNDSESGIYFNGKLARVETIDDEGVHVRLSGSGGMFTLRQEVWENKRYSVNERTREMDEDVIGTFKQYPVRLAWAITVHKSQGLTFERAVIDVGQAFAPGQVYVALSRLTSLDGLLLRTRIDPSVVSTDAEVIAFSRKKDEQGELQPILQKRQADYLLNVLHATFDLADVESDLSQLMQKQTVWQEFEDAEMREALPQLASFLGTERENLTKFRVQLHRLLTTDDRQQLLQRITSASDYFGKKFREWLRHLLIHLTEVRTLAQTKTYSDSLAEMDLLLMKKWEELQKARSLADDILSGRDVTLPDGLTVRRADFRSGIITEVREHVAANPKNLGRKTGRVRKQRDPMAESRPKKEKGETQRTSIDLLKQGLSVEEVAKQRGLQPSTIEGHAAKGIAEGTLDVGLFLTPAQLEEIKAVLPESDGPSMGEARDKLNGKYSFGQLRMALAAKING